MRRLLAAILIPLAFAGTAFAYVSPDSPTGFVNDYAGVLSGPVKTSLESELTQFEKDTSNEITVAIIPDLGGDYIENYAVKLFEEWGVGKKDRDNGVLLLLAIEDREMRIEVGYGLEGALPDSLSQRILDDEMTPKLRDGDYDGAVSAGVHAIQAATKGEYTPTKAASTGFGGIADYAQFIFFGVVFGFQWLAAILGRSRRWWPGGILGIAVGVIVGLVFSLGGGIIILITTLLGIFGFGFDYLVSNAFRSAKSSGGTPPWWAGGGGSGRSGGSFGGFGGGSSGGGGASGRW